MDRRSEVQGSGPEKPLTLQRTGTRKPVDRNRQEWILPPGCVGRLECIAHLFAPLLFLFVVVPCRAATISVAPVAGSDISIITVEGDLAVNDYEIFRQKAATVMKAIVAFRSDGGNLLSDCKSENSSA